MTLSQKTMCVSDLVHRTLTEISKSTDTESFTNVIACFKPSDAKPLASIRYWTLRRDDGVNVLKSVMKKSHELIADDLPGWIALHSLDQISFSITKTVLEEAFKYLTSFATEDVLAKALSIVKRNEHYQVDSQVMCCCNSQDHIPQDLFDKLHNLWNLSRLDMHLSKRL